MDEESETLMMHIATLMPLYKNDNLSSQKAQISALIQDKVSTKVLLKYANYADVFSFNLAMEFLENIGINMHVIKLQKS